MTNEEFRKLLRDGETVFGNDLFADANVLDLKTITGRTNTWARKLLLWMFLLSWFYLLNDLIIKYTRWLIGMVIIVPLHIVMDKLPVVQVIQPITELELIEIIECRKNPDY